MSAKIFVGVTDNLPPELKAMTIARYSRDVGSVLDRMPTELELADTSKAKDNMEKYYIGYNHKSVGQLAGTDIFFEGVSLLAAKSIEDNALFQGQESSTRYIDFTNQPFIKVKNDSEADSWQERFRSLYLKALPLTIEDIKNKFPYSENCEYNETVYNNTVNARAFDICRGLLPAGITTNVAFLGSFDIINDHFGEMLFHPLEEVRNIANDTLIALNKKYPFGIKDINKLKELNSYLDSDKYLNNFYYTYFYTYSDIYKGVSLVSNTEDIYFDFKERAKYQKIPRCVSNKIRFNMRGALDFGSFRDLHRHRNGYTPMPVLDTYLGFEQFYIMNLPDSIREEVINTLKEFQLWITKVYETGTSDETGIIDIEILYQYVVPIGYKVEVDYSCDINQLMYIMELRTDKTVHNTLREFINDIADQFKLRFPNIKIHNDESIDNFTLRRGTQTIKL